MSTGSVLQYSWYKPCIILQFIVKLFLKSQLSKQIPCKCSFWILVRIFSACAMWVKKSSNFLFHNFLVTLWYVNLWASVATQDVKACCVIFHLVVISITLDTVQQFSWACRIKRWNGSVDPSIVSLSNLSNALLMNVNKQKIL